MCDTRDFPIYDNFAKRGPCMYVYLFHHVPAERATNGAEIIEETESIYPQDKFSLESSINPKATRTL